MSASELHKELLLENKQGGKKSRPTGETTAQVLTLDVNTTSVSEKTDKVTVSVGHQEEKFSCDSKGSIVVKTEAQAMATTDLMLPPQRKVIWPRRVEQQEPKAIPPWAERDAQPPPPPISHYTSPSSTRSTSNQSPYMSKNAPSSTPSTRRHLPEASTLTKQTRMSKSESQINKATKTSGALKGTSISKGTTTDFTTSAPHNSLPSTAAFVSPPTATATGARRGAETAIDTLSERATCANEMLKLEAQITAGGAGAVGQVAKTSCGSSYCGDATSGGRQSSALAQTDQAAREQSAGKVLAEMVTVKPGDGKFVAKSDKMGEGPVKGPLSKSPVGKRAAGNVKIGSGVLRKDDSWRKEGSLKAAQMPQSPRLDSRKYKSEFASSQPVIQQPTIAEQEGELPDAPWRKSPKQPRKPVATSNQATAPSEVIPEALPETAATNVSEQIASTSTESVVAKCGVSSSVSVSEKTVFKSSSISEISESLSASSKLSESSSSSSLLSSSQVLSNPANLPPHAPIQHKKISGSPRGSPKNSPVLPRRGAQCTPPPAPPSSSKPPVASGVSESVGTFEAAGKTSLGSDAGSESRRAESSSESKSSDTLVSFDQSPPIVLRNTVVPIPDTLPSSREEVNESFGKTTTVPPTSLPVSENARARKNESISFSESVSEISESKESIKSVFDAESAQLSSLASPQGVNLPPPPPPSSNEEDDSVLPPFPPPPPPPPPPTFITESQASASFNFHSSMSAPEDYVPVPITSRILSFEKQSSTEQEMPEERHIPEIKPVGPWVKKTSTGPVSRPDGWLLSPEEDKTWPQQVKQQPLGQKSGQTDEAQIEPQFYYEIGNTSGAIQPPQEFDSPHPPAPKPHFYQPHQYQSPAQLQQNKEQGSPQFKKQLRKQPSPLQARKQQPSPQQQSFKARPLTDASLRQEQQQKILDDDGAPRRETRDNQGPCPRPRLGSTSEQINLHYSQAQLMAAPSPLAGGSSAQSPDDGDTPLFDPWCDPLNPRVIQFQDVSAAAFKIKSGILNTPCTRSNMSVSTGMEIFFKKEFNQYTGSFKERGARYTLLSLTPEQKVKGVIAASAGNHALALSYHGQDLGIPVTVVMPLVAPIMKVQCCRQYGANILVRGSDIGECRTIALKMARDQDLVYINGYDHPHILAGQGTMGLEIVEQVPNIDAVVVPVGGGGLIAGVALAVKALYPHIQVIGVESENCPSFSAALKNGSPVYTKPESTLADGLAVPLVGVNAFATAAPLVDKVVTVREEWIAIAILRLVEQEKAVVEGAGATALAAILAGELPELKGKRVVIPLCGGNIDTTVLGRCLERGLAADGRLVKFTVTVSDRPGGIAELTRLMASLGVSIKDMTHERAWIRSDIFSVEVKVLCETRDHEHYLQLKSELSKRYKIIRFAVPDVIHSETDM